MKRSEKVELSIEDDADIEKLCLDTVDLVEYARGIATKNLTIGILLCKENNDALVEITLPQHANIYASEYKLYLPDKKLLQKKLQEWIAEEE